MKKIIALLLAVCLVASLCACGSSAPAEAPATEKTHVEKTPAPEKAPAEAAPAATKAPKNEAAEEPAPAEEPEEEVVPFEKGDVAGNTYENKSIGVGCSMDSSWYIYNDEEVAEVMGITADILTDGGMADAIESGATVCDFYAMDEDLNTVNIQVSKFDNLMDRFAVKFMSEQDVVDATFDELTSDGTDKMMFDSLGLLNGKIEKDFVTFNGNERPCINISGVFDIDGMEVAFYECIVIVVNGGYTATITAGSYFEDTTADTLANFKLL